MENFCFTAWKNAKCVEGCILLFLKKQCYILKILQLYTHYTHIMKILVTNYNAEGFENPHHEIVDKT